MPPARIMRELPRMRLERAIRWYTSFRASFRTHTGAVRLSRAAPVCVLECLRVYLSYADGDDPAFTPVVAIDRHQSAPASMSRI